HLSALLLRPPPWSTLFPSTTLFRSEAEPGSGGLAAGGETRVLRGALGGVAGAGPTGLLALLAALRGGTGASHAGDGTHAGDVGGAAACDGLHHLGRLIEAGDELVHVCDGHSGAARDPQAPRAVEDLRVAALAGRHRADDRLSAVDLALVEVIELLLHLAHAGQHPEHLLHRAHLLHLLKLLKEV